MATSYVGIKNPINLVGAIGNFEKTYSTTEEDVFFKKSSQYKFGSSSRAFQQSASASALTYVLASSSSSKDIISIKANHKYYVSIWINQRTNLTSSISVKIGNTEAINKVKNTATSSWQHYSAIYTASSTENVNISIVCNNYPGNSAIVNMDGLMIIDLTDTYGAGYEPTRAWCIKNIEFTTNTATSSSARETKSMYIGIDGVAREVLSAYIGDSNGKAQLFYGGGFYFFINSKTYFAEEGMTWGEWVDSSYNTEGFECYSSDADSLITDPNRQYAIFLGPTQVGANMIINWGATYVYNIPR